jgi:hypothetical protein
MSFRQLCTTATVIRGQNDPLHLVHEWCAKRETLNLQLSDLPLLVKDYKSRKRKAHPTKPNLTYIDNVPVRDGRGRGRLREQGLQGGGCRPASTRSARR